MVDSKERQRLINERLQQAFDDALWELQKAQSELVALRPTTPEANKINALYTLADRLVELYTAAEATNDVFIVMGVEQKQLRFEKFIEQLVTTGVIDKNLQIFFNSHLTVLKAGRLGSSELKHEIATQAQANLAKIPSPSPELTKVIPSISDLAQTSIDETFPSYTKINSTENLADIIFTFVDWELLQSKDTKRGLPIRPFDDNKELQQNVIDAMNFVEEGSSLDPNLLEKLQKAVHSLTQLDQGYRAMPDVRQAMRDLKVFIYTVLKKNRNNIIGLEPQFNDYLAPAALDSAENIHDTMFLVLREFGESEIAEVEKLALLVEQAVDKKKALSGGELEKLQSLENKVNKVRVRYRSLLTATKNFASPDLATDLADTVREINRYSRWLAKLIADTEVDPAQVTTESTLSPDHFNLRAVNAELATTEWERFIEACKTPEDFDSAFRELKKQIYDQKVATQPTYNLPEANAYLLRVHTYWEQACRRIGANSPDKAEYDYVIDKSANIISLADASFEYGNGESLTADIIGNLEKIESGVRAGRMREINLYYFELDGPNKYRHADLVNEAILFGEELLTEDVDPDEDGLPPSQRKGRFKGYNFDASNPQAKKDFIAELEKYIEENSTLNAGDRQEVVEIVFDIMNFTGIGFDTYAERMLRGISPRNLLAVRRNNIGSTQPHVDEAYTTYTEAKYAESALFTEIDPKLLHHWHDEAFFEEAGSTEVQNKETQALHNVLASWEGTELFRKQYAPLRQRYLIRKMKYKVRQGNRDVEVERNIIESPFPTFYQLFVLRKDERYTFLHYKQALTGYKAFMEQLLAEVRVHHPEDLAKSREHLMHGLFKLLDNFSNIKSVPVDWEYFAIAVLHYIDKMYFAYAEVDKDVQGSERLAELILNAFGRLTGREYWNQFAAQILEGNFNGHPHAHLYLKAVPYQKFTAHDGMKWMFKNYMQAALADKSDDETLRRQPRIRTRNLTTDRRLYTAFIRKHSLFAGSIKPFGVTKEGAQAEGAAAQNKGGGGH